MATLAAKRRRAIQPKSKKGDRKPSRIRPRAVGGGPAEERLPTGAERPLASDVAPGDLYPEEPGGEAPDASRVPPGRRKLARRRKRAAVGGA